MENPPTQHAGRAPHPDQGPQDEEAPQHEAMGHGTHGRDAEHEAHRDHEVHMEHTGHGPESDHEAHGDHTDREEHGDHGAHVDHAGHEKMFRRRFWVCLVLSIPVLFFSPALQAFFGYTAPAFQGSQWITPILSVIIFLYGGLPFLQMALPELRNRQPGMMTLISMAITVAFAYSLATLFVAVGTSFFWELVTLIDVMLLGHWIEMRSVRRASGALDELARLMPDIAERIAPDGQIHEVPVGELEAGDLVLVRPGASVPADGEVVEGHSAVNEAMITGESRPVEKEPGDKVIAGTVNGDGSLRARVVATGEETALAGIMRLVRDAQESKSRTQLLADQAAAWLFYIAVATAIITAIAWIVAVGFEVDVVARVATVLVIACPHALGLAIPLVVAITTTLAASNGILIRDRLALEAAREIDTVLFDKTGTLTRGEFGVAQVAVVDGWTEADALALAAAVEGDSEHMLARGIRLAADERDLDLPPVTGFEALKGRGVRAQQDGTTTYVGGPNLLEELELEPPPDLAAFVQDAEQKSQTVVYLLQDDQNEAEPSSQVIAAFGLADLIRPESKQAVDRLQEMGVEVAMITGDSKAVAQAVARELHIDRYFAEVLPENKDRHVSDLQAQGRRVAMVGDGVNDAPALARADVGIAIGSGTDVAVESAGIILVKNDPLDIVKIVNLSRASYRKMIQNLWWAAGYNIVALPLAAGVLAPLGIVLSPAVGALLMSFSTVIVAVNAQLLRRADLGR